MASDEQYTMFVEQDNLVKVFWLPKEVSQSYKQESKACTLIAVLVITHCHLFGVKFSQEIPTNHLIEVFTKSIGQGNKIYEKLNEIGFLKFKYLNIPEALFAVSSETNQPIVEWESHLYNTDMYDTLFSNVNVYLQRWAEDKPVDVKSDLGLVILANLRAVVAIFSAKSRVVTLLDSHGHCTYGAVIAVVTERRFESLCKWYATQLRKDTGPIDCYEISFLYCQ